MPGLAGDRGSTGSGRGRVRALGVEAQPTMATTRRRTPAPKKKAPAKAPARSRATSRPRARRAPASAPWRPRMPELAPHQLDLLGLGLVALGVFLAFVMYFGSAGGQIGSAAARRPAAAARQDRLRGAGGARDRRRADRRAHGAAGDPPAACRRDLPVRRPSRSRSTAGTLGFSSPIPHDGPVAQFGARSARRRRRRVALLGSPRTCSPTSARTSSPSSCSSPASC